MTSSGNVATDVGHTGVTSRFEIARADHQANEIFVVDDEPAVRALLAMLLSRHGFNVTSFAEGEGLLLALRTRWPLCVLLDVLIPGKSGLDVLKEMKARECHVPVFIISGRGDISTAVDAIKNGALDFFEKPFRGPDIVARIRDGIVAKSKPCAADKTARYFFPGRPILTRREQDVLSRLVAGSTNKLAGRDLGVSHRTIEIHRSQIMAKLAAKNSADLVRIALTENQAGSTRGKLNPHSFIKNPVWSPKRDKDRDRASGRDQVASALPELTDMG